MLDLDRSTWASVRFGDFVRNVNETVKEPSAAGIDKVIALEHLDPGELTIDRYGDVACGTTFTRRVRPGQTLFGKRRAYQRKAAYAEVDAICSGDILVFEADPEQLSPRLLPFLVHSDAFFDHALGTSAGSLSPRTSWRALAKYEFYLPPLDEQERISDLLWAVERERGAVRSLTQATAEAVSALVTRYFVGAGEGTLGDLCDPNGIRIGPFGAQLHAHEYEKSGEYPVVMPQDMVDGRISTAKIQCISAARANDLAAYRLQAGDILLPRRGELDRRALVTDAEEGWVCGTGSVRVRLRQGVDPRAVVLALSSRSTVRWLQDNASGTTMPNLNAGIVARIPISLPSGDQLAAAMQRVHACERAVNLGERRSVETRELRRALLAGVLGGTV